MDKNSLSKIAEENTLAVGSLFDRYQILDVLGVGGMGKVYKACDQQTQRIVALKTLLNASSPTLVERFIMEAKATARFKHPGIVEIYDIGKHQNMPYFTMEYIEGSSLKGLIKEQKLTLAQKIELMKKIVVAVAYAHEEKVIHRDLKPDNIMIDKEGNPHIMDFGLAKLMDNNSKNFTRTGTIVGTLKYMPPEQVEGKKREIDHRCDIYSLGVIFYELIIGKSLFGASSQMEIIKKILIENPPAPSSINPRISKELDKICLKAMAKKKEKRYQNAKEMASDLANFRKHKKTKTRSSKTPAKKYMFIFAFIFFLIAAFFLIKNPTKKVLKKNVAKKNAKKSWLDIMSSEKISKQTLKDLCFIKNGKMILDASGEPWEALSVRQRARYIALYQAAYANSLGLPVEKDHPIGEGVYIPMKFIPPGRFWQGGKDLVNSAKKFTFLSSMPKHKVTIEKPFYMAKTEITEEQWKCILKKHEVKKGLKYPVGKISWQQCQEYCQKINASLPSESQWEYACRAGSLGLNFWEKEEGQNYANYSQKKLMEVAKKQPNMFGLYDMIGSLWEWCQDFKNKTYRGAPTDGSSWQSKSSARVYRGGSHNYGIKLCNSISRKAKSKNHRHRHLGFRIVLAIE